MIRQRLRHWRALTDQALSECLTDLEISSAESARAMLSCFRAKPADATTPYQAPKVGMFSAAAHLAWFEFAFRLGYPDTWEQELAEFVDRIAMPRGSHPPYDAAQWDIVAEWFSRGVPNMDDILEPDPAPIECTPGVSADVAAHVADMQLRGWRAVNAERNILMHGCEGTTSTLECLKSYPLASEQPFGVGWEHMPNATLRVLREKRLSIRFLDEKLR